MDRLTALQNSKPLERTVFGDQVERFVITTSTQQVAFGPGWKRIVIEPSNEQSSLPFASTEPVHDEWIRVDDTAEPLRQFARRWRESVRNGWQGRERRAGVA
jgi:hypothetical protein